MWTHNYQQQTDVSVEALWSVLANVSDWAEIDEGIEAIHVKGIPAQGSEFMLKPKGGPQLNFRIGDFEPPALYSDICRMPFATMKTTHRLLKGEVTTISIEIVIEGILSPLWSLMVGRKHANGLPEQTQRFIAAARSLQNA